MVPSKEKIMKAVEYFKLNRSINEVRGIDKSTYNLLVDLGILKKIGGRVITLDGNYTAVHTYIEVIDDKNPRIKMRSVIFGKLRDIDKVYIIWKGYSAEPIPVVEKGEFEIRPVQPLPWSVKYTTTSIQFINPVVKLRFVTDQEVMVNLSNINYHAVVSPSGEVVKGGFEKEKITAPSTLYVFYSK
ncbi:hypothetical protein [Stygiolobus caldivivus]|uniref:Uncharacterized protein n=1 Tax=Stygiolobus caldivivus TaxID=2824673 RepID=A0A8D5U4B0_9CREN|nr:hypothetical protein [Stygiolobus caldivivus]BCU68709.1 hypothetical protein KN1_00060 [Stygiolobus caldivivus]